MSPVSPFISRDVYLEKVSEKLNHLNEYIERGIEKTLYDYQKIAKIWHEIDCSLGFLESIECGSYGGFDENQPRPLPGREGLRMRLEWLLRKRVQNVAELLSPL